MPDPLSENRDLSTNEHLVDLRPVSLFEFVRCGPVKKTERSISLGLIMIVQRSSRMHLNYNEFL